jgi:alkyl hydroperoxide reductase subunit AhpC
VSAVAHKYADLQKLGCEVVSVSVDSHFAHKMWNDHVQAYQHVRKTQGAEATPAGWMPGGPTLKPGPDLVGNVWKAWKPSMEPALQK